MLPEMPITPGFPVFYGARFVTIRLNNLLLFAIMYSTIDNIPLSGTNDRNLISISATSQSFSALIKTLSPSSPRAAMETVLFLYLQICQRTDPEVALSEKVPATIWCSQQSYKNDPQWKI